MPDIIPIPGKVYWEERDTGLVPVTYDRRTDSYTDIVWTPQAGSQEAFLRSGVYELLYSGTRGPGKTDAMLMDFAQFVGVGLGTDWRGILFRRTYPELADVISKSRKLFSQIFPDARYNAGEHYWTFPGGETLLFRHFKTPDDYWSYHGSSFCWIGWEELTTWPTSECYLSMMSCARSSNKKVPIRIRSTTNPYGCVPYGEVLTSTRGWVPIQDIGIGESVVSVDTGGNLTDAEVSAVISRPWSGEMISYRQRGLRMEFTSDHRLPMKGTQESETHDVISYADIPTGCRTWFRRMGNVPADVPFDRDAALLGCLITTAYVTSQDVVRIPSCSHVVGEILLRCVVGWTQVDGVYHISDPVVVEVVRGLGKHRKRRLPAEYLESEWLFQSLMAIGSPAYTCSVGLVDDIQELSTRLGHATFSKYRVGNYEVSLKGASDYNLDTAVRGPFKGQVYCLSVPETETFFIRQNGSVWLSGNSGHTWVKHRWRLPAKPHRMCSELVVDSVDKNGDIEPPRQALMGHIRENHVLLYSDPGYIGRIKSSARNQAELEAWLHGSWDIVAGGMFDDIWDRNVHILPDFPLRQIPAGWRIDRSYDHGQSRPFSVGWWAESNGETLKVNHRVYGEVPGDLIRIAEWYGWTGEPNQGQRLLSSEIATGILEREQQMGLRGRVKTGIADGSIFDQYEPGLSVVGEMRKSGVDWYAADKGSGSRKQGWQQMREKLSAALPGPEGVREEAGLFVLESCEQTIRTLPVLPRSDKDLDDADTDAEDHICVVGNTVVYTPDGPRPTASLVGKDGVIWTPAGWQRFTNCRLTREGAKIIRLTSGRETIELTPDHQIATAGGWFKAEDIVQPLFYPLTNSLQDGHIVSSELPSGDVWHLTKEETLRSLMLSGEWTTPKGQVTIESAGRQDVYCLSVPATGCFVAGGGWVISNCDEIRYRCRFKTRRLRSGSWK